MHEQELKLSSRLYLVGSAKRESLVSRGRAAFGVRQHFVAAAEALAQSVPGVVTRRSWLRNGWLLWPSAPYP